MTRADPHPGVSVNSPAVVLPITMASLWSRTNLIRELWDIVQSVAAWRGARIVESRGGLTLAVNDVNLGHLKWGGQLVLGFGLEARTAIADETIGCNEPDQWGDVMVFNIRCASDVDRALCLLRFSYLISELDRNECRPSLAVVRHASYQVKSNTIVQ
jgi:hypothetical protein